MSADFLSQDEVDALLRGMTNDCDIEEEPWHHGRYNLDGNTYTKFDICNQERLVRGRMPVLEILHEKFVRQLRINTFKFLHRNIQTSVGPIRVQKYADFLRSLVIPTNLNLCRIEPFSSCMLWVFDPNLVFLLTEQLFGGDGRFHTRVEGREFTQIEHEVIDSFLEVCHNCYDESWKTILDQDIKTTKYREEINPQFANIGTAHEVVVATTFTIEMGGAQTDMHICIPYSHLEVHLKDKLYAGIYKQEGYRISPVQDTLDGIQFEMSYRMPPTTVSLEQFQNADVEPIMFNDTSLRLLYANNEYFADVDSDTLMITQQSNRYHDYKEHNMSLDLNHIPLQVSVEIGRSTITLKDLKELSVSSVIQLDTLAGDSLKIFVNGQHVANGDTVIVNDQFGVRVTEMVKPKIDTSGNVTQLPLDALQDESKNS